MSVELIRGKPPTSAFDTEPPIEAARVRDASSQVAGGHLPPAVVSEVSPDPIEVLLLAVARGDHEAFTALQSRISGLVRVNVRRVLRDVSRSEAVTQATFAEILEDAISFDPHLGDAQTWLLTRAHQHAIDELASQTLAEPHPAATTHTPHTARIPQPRSALPA